MPSENQQQDIRLVISDEKGNVDDLLLIGGGKLPDPLTWTELPPILKERGKIVEASRDAILDNVFRLKVDKSNN
jgi:hypothetical protein